ncbi:MAG: POTRA domain-containing protein [Terriglobia bacterium]
MKTVIPILCPLQISFCLLATLFAFNALLALPPGRLVAVHVNGSRRFSEAEIVRASGLTLGKEVSETVLKDAAGRLGATGLFVEVKYRYTTHGPEMTAEFQVSDTPTLLPCKFENLVWFTDEELRSKLRAQVPLFSGEVPASGNQPEKVAAALEGLLRSRGIKGRVESSGVGREGGPVEAIRFRVEDFPILIQQVDLRGTAQVESAALQAAQSLVGKDYAEASVSSFASSNLAPAYGQRGYLRVAFGSPAVRVLKTSPAETAVGVTILIHEGPQYRLGEIHWTGNKVFPASELAQSTHVVPGEPVNTVQLQQDLEAIRDMYSAKGYLQAAIEPRLTLEDAARTAVYEIQVREGDLYRMGKLEITGIEPFRIESLEKKCKMKISEPYNRKYWKEFIRDSSLYLAVVPGGWKADFKETVNEAAKTVDVTIGFGPGAKQ